MPPKRRREGSGAGGSGNGGGGGGGGGRRKSSPPPPPPPPPPAPPTPPASSRAPALNRRCRSFDLEIRGCRHLQELTTRVEAIETSISRIPEELRKVLTSYFNNVIPGARVEQNLPPTYKLSFVNSLNDEIFTKRDVRAVDGGHIKIKMVVSNHQDSNCARLLSSNVKIVVLDGDFNADSREGWTSEEFDDHIVRPRDKVGAVLTGKLDVKLEDGEAYLSNVTFIDNSSFTRSRKFRLGVKLLDDSGRRVQEGITEPFTVKDRRGEGYRKREIPRPDDEVWRLKKIAKGGVFHEALEKAGITSVKDLLRLYHKDAKAMRNILSNVKKSDWTTIVEHAKKCNPGRSLYSHFFEDKKIRLYFSALGQIVGATIADQYNAFGDLDALGKAQVEEWSKDAYKNMTYHRPDYELYNSQPRPINNTLQGSSTISVPKSTEPTDEQGTSNGTGFSGTCSQQCTLGRLGSVRVRAFSSVQENNQIDASFDIDVQMGSGSEVQYETLDANYTAGSVTLNCPTTGSEEIIASLAMDQAVLTMHQEDYQMSQAALTMHQEDYQMSYTDGPSLGHWYPEEQMALQYASPFPLSMQSDPPGLLTQNSIGVDEFFENLPNDGLQFGAPIASELPTDVRGDMMKLPSRRRWLKLSALVKWKAMVKASKRARLMFEQEGWSP